METAAQRYAMQLCKQILSDSMVSSFQSSTSWSHSILDQQSTRDQTAVTHEGYGIHSTTKDFLAWHVTLLQINNKLRDCN